MPEVFDALPGMEVPVGGIAEGFKKLWDDSPAKESRAVQLNLVLHLGHDCTPADAQERFQDTLRFAQRYPCRVVVLCPDYSAVSSAAMRAKIYGECFLGKSKNDTRCVEFVLLQYTLAVRMHLEDQVSVCLSTDLPLYYWAHRFAEAKKLADYHYLLTRSKRILFDGAHAPPGTFDFPWPNLSAVRDLAYTRTLPLRQNLGQFLSRYPPGLIIGGIKRVTLRHRTEFGAEANSLLGWVRKGLTRSGADLAGIAFEGQPAECEGCLEMSFTYADPARHFLWQADLAKNEATFVGDLGAGRSTLTVGASMLSPELTLAEAMFF